MEDEHPDFIPKWTSIFMSCFDDKNKFNYDKYVQLCDQNQMYMGQFRSCMVGEARGFDDSYKHENDKTKYCHGCYKLSMKACFLKQQKPMFISFKKELYNHITKDHAI